MKGAIYVDADACPVKDEVIRVAERHSVKVFIVSNGGIRPNPSPMVETIVVPDGPDVADMWIADRASGGDIVTTGDIPLAARCIEGGAAVLKFNGEELNARNIGPILATRDLMSDIRAANPFQQGGGKAFGKADRSRFLDRLELLVRKAGQIT